MPDDTSTRGLGESKKPEYGLARVEVALPGSRKEMVAAFESILNQGLVQKVVFEVGKPILVTKLVTKDELAEAPSELPEDDLFVQARNATFHDLVEVPGESGYQTMFRALQALSEERLKPAKLYVQRPKQLWDWLSLNEGTDVRQIYGIDTVLEVGIPDDAVVLIGLPYDDNPEGVLGLRIPVDLPQRKTGPTIRGNT